MMGALALAFLLLAMEKQLARLEGAVSTDQHGNIVAARKQESLPAEPVIMNTTVDELGVMLIPTDPKPIVGVFLVACHPGGFVCADNGGEFRSCANWELAELGMRNPRYAVGKCLADPGRKSSFEEARPQQQDMSPKARAKRLCTPAYAGLNVYVDDQYMGVCGKDGKLVLKQDWPWDVLATSQQNKVLVTHGNMTSGKCEADSPDLTIQTGDGKVYCLHVLAPKEGKQ